ncbi:protein trichome birefringence-like [Aristolochia californica]|uniref:protein trichome birefringence-like n=1 Tax=Aristolochia californica TaxID=171875 RepID=UPI0035D9B492
MTDAAKQPSKGGSFFADVHSLFNPLRPRRTKIFAYCFLFAFVACTAFLAFNPSATSSPWFDRFFTSSTATASGYRSQFPSIFSYIFQDSPVVSPSPSPSESLIVDVKINGSGSVGGKSLTSPAGGEVPVGKNQTEPPTRGGVNEARVSNFTASSASRNTTSGVSEKPKNSTSSQVSGNQVEKRPGIQNNGTILVTGNRLNGTKPISNVQIKKVPRSEGNETKTGSDTPSNATKPVSDDQIKKDPSSRKNETKQESEPPAEKKKPGAGASPVASSSKEEISLDSLRKCDIFNGKWVKDDSYPLYKEGSCPHIDEPFDCFSNGRPDKDYQKLRWQPNGCKIPRLNATDMLERLRGRRLVFVGDSLNRNMWESLICILRNSVKDKRNVFEASGRREFRTEGSYSFLFQDYNCSVEFFRSPFLVQEWEMPESNGTKKETLRLDLIERKSDRYKKADVIVFNTGHWWTHEKTSLGKDYYQEGNHVYGQLNVVEAFHKALVTWAKWVDTNVDPKRTLVFFRGYSASHFSGGRWNSGGACDAETEPIYNETYLAKYPKKMRILETVISEMKTDISYLNITKMTDYRKDAHPSIYRKRYLTDEERRSPLRFQDCSHWCLPGVPDSWNELLYALLLTKLH